MLSTTTVAPFAGAWIEIHQRAMLHDYMASLPSRERGLKFEDCDDLFGCYMSLPSRERGLKYYLDDMTWVAVAVAPFAGAWIEIR